jgi:hypothetical protein
MPVRQKGLPGYQQPVGFFCRAIFMLCSEPICSSIPVYSEPNQAGRRFQGIDTMPILSPETGLEPVILCVGEDADLLDTRVLLLRSIGAEVHCSACWRILRSEDPESSAGILRSPDPDHCEQILMSMENIRFDLVILCHTIKRELACEIAGMVNRRQPSCKILLLESIVAVGSAEAGARFDAIASAEPASLLRAACRLLAATQTR